MGVKEVFTGASTMVKVALILLVVANLFSWIAFTTTSWGYIDSGDKTGYGLWRTCNEAFGIFGFVGLNVALLLVVLSLFVDACKGNAEAKMATIILCIAGAVCWLIAVILFAANWPDDVDPTNTVEDKFGFSFALAIVGLVAALISGVVLIVDSKGGGTSPA